MDVPFFRHNLGKPELAAVAEVFGSPFLTTGERVTSFEKRFARIFGSDMTAIGTNSCTAALHLSLHELGIKAGDEIITTPLSFVATSNAALYVGAKPVFVDIESETGNLDVSLVERAITVRTRAIIPVHLYGQMVDMKALSLLASHYGLKVIEDAAHCVEGSRHGIKPGELGDAACFSFHAIKTLTCGEGGALITRNTDLASKIRQARLHGITTSALDRSRTGIEQDMGSLGWKYNMTNIGASILLPQLEHLTVRLMRRQEICRRYAAAFAGKVRTLETLPGVAHARSCFAVLVPAEKRDGVIEYLKVHGVGSVRAHKLIYQTAHYRTLGYETGICPVAEQLQPQIVLLPCYSNLEEQEVDHVIETVLSSVKAS